MMLRALITTSLWVLGVTGVGGGAAALISTVRADPLDAPAPRAVAKPAKPIPAAAPIVPKPQPVAVKPAAEPGLVVKRVLDTGGPIKYGSWFWDVDGVPDGSLVITVDLQAETMSVFRDGYEIGATAILYGADDKPTPLGTFPITQKDKDHVSNLYDAPMPYMLRLTNDGVSIHASEVEWGYATHGCIGVPLGFAKKLFAVVKLGDRVIITRGKRIGLGDAVARS